MSAGLAFLAVFLDRSTPLSGDSIVWVLDGVLVGAILVMVQLLMRDPDGETHPWALNAFVLSMISGSFMSRRNTIVVPGGKMGMAVEIILTPIILDLLDGRSRQ